MTKTYGWQWYGGTTWRTAAPILQQLLPPRKFGIDCAWCEHSSPRAVGPARPGRGPGSDGGGEALRPWAAREVETRLRLSDEDMAAIMALASQELPDYETYKPTSSGFRPLFWMLYRAGYVTRSFD